jgi:hypothetical protein
MNSLMDGIEKGYRPSQPQGWFIISTEHHSNSISLKVSNLSGH